MEEINNQPDQTPGTADSGDVSVAGFFDALTAYAIDPTRWTGLVDQFDQLSEQLEHFDPGELMAALSRAESLSWHITQEGDPGRSGFAWILLDDTGLVVTASENIAELGDYLQVSEDRRLTFSTPESRDSLSSARANLGAGQGGHSLVSLFHPRRPRQRFGFLVSRAQFPPSLETVAGNADLALFIAQDDGSDRLQKVVQASFGLTAAEAEITVRLAHGQTLKEAAGEQEISINTARNHLQSVFDKSGINRQSDLVLVVTQLSVILAGTEGEAAATARRRRQSPPRHFMILENGRRLAYRTYGDSRGRPLLYMHETLGCSRLPPDTEELARQHGLYLMAPERPGFGFSDLDASFTFQSVAADLTRFLDHLHIGRATVLGYLSGGAYALSLAAAEPERVDRLVLVAGRPPRPMKGRFKHLMPLWNKMITHPWLMTSFFNILRNRSSPQTNATLINTVYGSVPHDRAYLASHPEMFQHMVTYTLESITATAAGIAAELKCFARAAETVLEPLGVPITAWHGLEDNLASIQDLEETLSRQSVSWRKFEGAGSLILLEHWEELLASIGNEHRR